MQGLQFFWMHWRRHQRLMSTPTMVALGRYSAREKASSPVAQPKERMMGSGVFLRWLAQAVKSSG